jgi:hypothetical protein
MSHVLKSSSSIFLQQSNANQNHQENLNIVPLPPNNYANIITPIQQQQYQLQQQQLQQIQQHQLQQQYQQQITPQITNILNTRLNLTNHSRSASASPK